MYQVHCRSTVREGPLTAFMEELNQRTTWYLVDEKKPFPFEAMTILTISPNREIYKVIIRCLVSRACCKGCCLCI